MKLNKVTVTFGGVLVLLLVLSLSGYWLLSDTTQLGQWLEQTFEWTNERYVLLLLFIVVFGR